MLKCTDTLVRNYTDLCALPTFEERFEYLRLDGVVGKDTFGYDRYLNQQFYASSEWKRIRDEIIVRDNGCDLGIDGYFIRGRVFIHHMNPIGIEDLVRHSAILVNPEYLICVSRETHNAIHYGDFSLISKDPIERKPNDTCPWKA
jgi:hypothetical protein